MIRLLSTLFLACAALISARAADLRVGMIGLDTSHVVQYLNILNDPKHKDLNPILKLVLELGPLGVFFFANTRGGIYTATAAFMIATLIALGVSVFVLDSWGNLFVRVFVGLFWGAFMLVLHGPDFVRSVRTLKRFDARHRRINQGIANYERRPSGY